MQINNCAGKLCEDSGVNVQTGGRVSDRCLSNVFTLHRLCLQIRLIVWLIFFSEHCCFKIPGIHLMVNELLLPKREIEKNASRKHQILTCVCVCCDSRSHDRHPKIEGWEVFRLHWGMQSMLPFCHPSHTPALSLGQARSGAPCVTNRWASHKRTPRSAKPVSLHTRLNLNSKVRIDALSPWWFN